LHTLKAHPELQDKVEFEIVLSCYDLTFDHRIAEISQACHLSSSGATHLRCSLLQFTQHLLAVSAAHPDSDVQLLRALRTQQAKINAKSRGSRTILEQLTRARSLLLACRDLGVVPFARFARLAFVGIGLLRSLAKAGILNDISLAEYVGSLNTIAAQMRRDFSLAGTGRVNSQWLLARYGHLRPGTYNIRSPRLDTMPSLLDATAERALHPQPTQSVCRLPTEKIQRAFDEAHLRLSADLALQTIGRMIELRERAKFEFTKVLSDAIEVIAVAGEMSGIDRTQMALADLSTVCGEFESDARWRSAVIADISRQSELQEIYCRLALPACLSSKHELFIIPDYPSRPNFVTNKVVSGKPFVIPIGNLSNAGTMAGAIVLLESADPGYDWLFTRNILGLITKYGGVASHMAIRCAEFGIPAAVGCGEMMFDRLATAARISLDCAREVIDII